MISNIFSAYL